MEKALAAANAIGDDRLQRQTQGRVVPESFTHGSSPQRQAWFTTGVKTGSVQRCNTFAPDAKPATRAAKINRRDLLDPCDLLVLRGDDAHALDPARRTDPPGSANFLHDLRAALPLADCRRSRNPGCRRTAAARGCAATSRCSSIRPSNTTPCALTASTGGFERRMILAFTRVTFLTLRGDFFLRLATGFLRSCLVSTYKIRLRVQSRRAEYPASTPFAPEV